MNPFAEQSESGHLKAGGHMPCAFLSHSSRDKGSYVSIVAARLARAHKIYDEETFEAGMKAIGEIFRTLEATDLFVLFISEHSLSSDWVKKEISQASDLNINEKIKRIFPIIIDPTIKHDDLRIPKWMQERFNLKYISRPSVASRLIQQQLRELSWENHPRIAERQKIFVGRNDLISEIEERFGDIDKRAPVCIIASGLPSIGRKTLLRQAIYKSVAAPRMSYSPPLVSLSGHESIEDFILKIHDLGFSDIERPINLLKIPLDAKIELAYRLCLSIANVNDFILIEDETCLVHPETGVSSWFAAILSKLSSLGKLVFVVASRFRPFINRDNRDLIFPIQVPELNSSERMNLFRRLSEIEGLELTMDDLRFFRSIITGFPEQVFYLVTVIKDEGLNFAKNNSYLFIEFNQEKIEKVMKYAIKCSTDLDLLVLLSEFDFISYDLLNEFISLDDSMDSLARFLSTAVCEQLGAAKEHIRVNNAVRDYVKRLRYKIPDRFLTALSIHAKQFLSRLESEEIDASDYLYSLKQRLQKGENVPVKYLIPSHFLKAMKELYDRHRKFKEVIRLADQVLDSQDYLDPNIQREIRYYLCQSLARRRDNRFVQEIQYMHGPEHAFLYGFFHRMKGQLEQAIEKQKEAMSSSRTAQRARRELIQIYIALEDFESARNLAEINYSEKRNNLFAIEGLVKCLINAADWKNNQTRILELIEALRILPLNKAKEMHYGAKAQFLSICLGDLDGAEACINLAIQEFPGNPYPVFTKLFIIFRKRNLDDARICFAELERVVKSAEQFSDTLIKMRAQLLALEGKLPEAKSLVDKQLQNIPVSAKRSLLRKIETLSLSAVPYDYSNSVNEETLNDELA